MKHKTLLTSFKERPILFNGEMIRAILKGRKTQTRRVIKPQPKNQPYPYQFPSGEWAWKSNTPHQFGLTTGHFCPYGQPGDRLWIRETWLRTCGAIYYRADDTEITRSFPKWKSPIFMPYLVSRITLEITGVRVERVQDISEGAAMGEGFEPLHVEFNRGPSYRDTFKETWNFLNAKRGFGWDANPWVWVIEFKRVEI